MQTELPASFLCNNEFSSKERKDELLHLTKADEQSICLAAWNNNMRVLRGLIDQVKKGENMAGYGPTHFAAALGNVEILEFLLSNGIDKNERDAAGNSALMWVVASDGSQELMEALVDHGCDVNLQNFEGESALSLCCQRGYEEKAEYLLENGAMVNGENLEGACPIHLAAAGGHLEILSLLVQYGAFVNAVDYEGDTPLHWAVREGQTQATKRLIELGANGNLCNEDGETALDLASCLEDDEAIKTLSFLGSKAGSGFLGQHLSGEVGAGSGANPVESELSGEMHKHLNVARVASAGALDSGRAMLF